MCLMFPEIPFQKSRKWKKASIDTLQRISEAGGYKGESALLPKYNQAYAIIKYIQDF